MQFGKTFGAIDVSSEIIASSERYNNVENTTRLGGYALLNLTVNYILLPEWRLESRWNNVLDKEYALSKDYAGENYNTPGSNLFVGIRWQPK